jgi:DNA-directed RNA polymerase subunit M/transcription elongation factor TFIIS
MSSKFAQKFNIAIRRAEEMINEERRHNEARHNEARHNEARKDLAFWQQQDLSHDYRETTSFEHELLNAITSRR